MTRIRFVSDSLKHDNINVVSEEIRSDRQRTDLATVGYSVTGDVDAELTYGDYFDPAIEAALCGTWTTNVLRNGTTNRSFRMEKGWLDLGKYSPMRGVCINTLDLDVTSRRIVRFRVGYMGRGAEAGVTTSVSGTTALTQPSSNAPIRAGDLIQITSAGTSGPLDFSTGISASAVRMTINNNLRERPLATQYYTDDFGRGVMEITGTVEAYFKDILIFNQFRTNGLFSLRWTMRDPDLVSANTYRITLPKLKVTDAPIPTPGLEQDIIQTINWRALVDTGVGYTIDVTRALTT